MGRAFGKLVLFAQLGPLKCGRLRERWHGRRNESECALADALLEKALVRGPGECDGRICEEKLFDGQPLRRYAAHGLDARHSSNRTREATGGRALRVGCEKKVPELCRTPQQQIAQDA